MTRFSGTLVALLLLLSACAPCEQAWKAPVAVPKLTEHNFTASDGTHLPLSQWMPRNPRAILIGVHGFNDYSHGFAQPANYFMKRNIGLIAYDQRGFGRSKDTGIWGGEDNFVSDLREIVKATKADHPSIPVFVLAESMGGAVAMVALSQPDFPKVNGLILVAPAVWGDGTLSPILRGSLWLLAHTMPSNTIESTGDRFRVIASSNIPMLMDMGRDPLVIKKTRIDAVYGLMHLMDDAYMTAGNVRPPILMLYGAHDQIIPPRPVRDTLFKLQSPYRFAFYPEGYHMLLRDLKADIVLKDIVAWTANTSAPLPSGLDKRWQEYKLEQHVEKQATKHNVLNLIPRRRR